MAAADALASFEDKWSLAHPELPLALHFAQQQVRPIVSALACVSFEVGLAAYGVTEAGIGASKLQWWAEELALLPGGKARHPLTLIMAGSPALRSVQADIWQAWIGAAFAQREAAPARSQDALLASYRSFYEPLSRIKSALYPELSMGAEAQAAALSRIMLETIRLDESLSAERLPLPLDLLARHGVSRSELGGGGEPLDSVLREHFSTLADCMKDVDRRGLSPMTAASLAADLKRCRLSASAAHPLEASASKQDRLPFSALWACWRAARRVHPVV